MVDFVHLHGHTEYSLLDGLCQVQDLVKKAKDLGMKAMAITDHGTMFGAIEFYKACLKVGIKPIIGCEVYMASRSLHDKEAGKDQDRNHLILLAKNKAGYQNLMKLVTKAHLEGYYYRPRIDRELLKTHTEGLIALSGCMAAEIPNALRENRWEDAKKATCFYAQLFEEGNFYIELQRHAIEDLQKVNEGLLTLSHEFSLPIVATNDFHYINVDDAQAQDVLLCVQTGKTVGEKNRLSLLDSPDFYVKSSEEMAQTFSDLPWAIENSNRIAEACDLTLTLGHFIFPAFQVPEGETPESFLRRLVQERMSLRYPKITKEVTDRMEFELDIICKKDYATYFLVIHDLVDWSKREGIAVGPGRGSAAGSIVSYILGITSIDPLFYGLPFERFLNPFRSSAPDIDLDFADNRRKEVVAYVTKKYGVDHVAQISTFGTMAARQAVRDVGRALGHPYAFPDKIAKLIPFSTQTNYIDIKKSIELVPELKQMYEIDPEAKKLLDLARKLEGVTRHASVHAAGVVIAPKPLTQYTPLMREADGDKLVTQYEMHSIGEDGVGLLKMDLLGLANLTILQNALEIIRSRHGVTIKTETIPLDDRKTYEMLSRGETTGVFQLESAGMRRYIKELKPSNVFDLMAMVALFRPGPLNSIPEYVNRKHNPNLITYIDPRVEKILERSLGLLVYQDDVLLIAIELAGYDWQEVDKLRKAMGKKKPAEMAAQKEKFISRAVERGMKPSIAQDLWQQVEIFAGYGFNKAHAACYGLLAYQTAYLKANYPVEYMSAVMSTESQNTDKIVQAMEECKRTGIRVLPPSVNRSMVDFSIEDTSNGPAIRFGLSAIKNVGVGAIESVLKAREQGHFSSLYDFISKADLRLVNKKTLESLVKVGASLEFGSRVSQLAVLEQLLSIAHDAHKQKGRGQISLFGESNEQAEKGLPLPNIPEVEKQTILLWEKELLGFYFTEHPLASIMDQLTSKVDCRIASCTESLNGRKVAVGGIIEKMRRTFTKTKNEEMAFVQLADDSGTLEVVIFPRTFERSKALLQLGQPIVVSGKVDAREDRLSLIADSIYLVSDAPSVKAKEIQQEISVTITIPRNITRSNLHAAYEILKMYPGSLSVGLAVQSDSSIRILRVPYQVQAHGDLKLSLENIFGEGCVRFQ